MNGSGDGIRLGFDTYSLRALKWKDVQFIDYAAGLGLDTVQISSSDDYASLDPAHLRQVREHAERAGIRIDAGIGCVCPISASWNVKDGPAPEKIIDGLKVAKAVGAASMRCRANKLLLGRELAKSSSANAGAYSNRKLTSMVA